MHASDALDHKNGGNWLKINNLIVMMKVETVGDVYFSTACWGCPGERAVKQVCCY